LDGVVDSWRWVEVEFELSDDDDDDVVVVIVNDVVGHR
jgi:hypothetical protein